MIAPVSSALPHVFLTERGQRSLGDDAHNTTQYNALHVENVTARTSDEELDLVERLADAKGESRSDAIRQAIR